MTKLLFKKDYDWTTLWSLPEHLAEQLLISKAAGYGVFEGKIRVLITHITEEDNIKEKENG